MRRAFYCHTLRSMTAAGDAARCALDLKAR